MGTTVRREFLRLVSHLHEGEDILFNDLSVFNRLSKREGRKLLQMLHDHHIPYHFPDIIDMARDFLGWDIEPRISHRLRHLHPL